jgi:hypothetical protein
LRDNDEPVFTRSKWGTNRYVYNANNPVGLALTVISLLAPIVLVVAFQTHWSWSDGELRDAVQQANRTLDGSIHDPYRYTSISDHIRDAVESSGSGPGSGALVRDEGHDEYEISTDDTDVRFCMRVDAPVIESGPAGEIYAKRLLHTSLTEGPC